MPTGELAAESAPHELWRFKLGQRQRWRRTCATSPLAMRVERQLPAGDLHIDQRRRPPADGQTALCVGTHGSVDRCPRQAPPARRRPAKRQRTSRKRSWRSASSNTSSAEKSFPGGLSTRFAPTTATPEAHELYETDPHFVGWSTTSAAWTAAIAIRRELGGTFSVGLLPTVWGVRQGIGCGSASTASQHFRNLEWCSQSRKVVFARLVRSRWRACCPRCRRVDPPSRSAARTPPHRRRPCRTGQGRSARQQPDRRPGPVAR